VKAKVSIGILSPFREYTRIALEAAEEVGIEVDVREEPLLRKAVEIAREWERDGSIEVIIARSPAANGIGRANIQLPVITVDVDNFNLVETIYRSYLSGARKFAVVDWANRQPPFKYDLIEKMFNISIHPFLLNKEIEVDQKVHEAKRIEPDVLICTWLYIFETAISAGLRVELVHCGLESLKEAIKQAAHTASVRRYDKKEKLKLATIINNVNDGILVVDDSCQVLLSNFAAAKIVQLAPEQLIGHNIGQLPPGNPMHKIYGENTECNNELLDVQGSHLVVTRKQMQVAGLATDTVITFQPVERIRKIEEGIRKELYAKRLIARFGFQDIVGNSAIMLQKISEAKRYALSNGVILINGESGTGKELFAHGIHLESRRRKGPFVAVNCATIPNTLIESELFGYEEGAFTGAKKGGKQGLFELAHGGTIFLDEIGELRLDIQARLLRVLQEREIMRVGGNRLLPIDVRVICATNRNLEAEVKHRRFRQDLFYRLNVLNIEIPPLRDRLEDIPLLFTHFLNKAAETALMSCPAPAAKAIDELKNYDWPGNVRELQNFAERYIALGETDIKKAATFRTLFAKLQAKSRQHPPDGQAEIKIKVGTLEEMERQIIPQAQKVIHGGKVELAKVLGVSRQTLWKKLKETK
jgi:transcriptional regulator with PAS, ATPase and Fis domain